MAKVKGIIVACLLILMSFAFVACGQMEVETLSFDKQNISISVGDRVDLDFQYSPTEVSLDEIEFSTSDSSVAYVLPGTTTLAGLKAGSVVVYAKAKNGKTASMNVEVLASRVNLSVPQNLKINRTENKLSWIASPGAFNYEIEIEYNNKSITKTTAESFLSLDEIDDLTFTPGEIVAFRIRAMAPMASNMYSNSDWSEWVKYNELNPVQNLKYDITTNMISFAYDPEDQVIDGKEICFYLTINGVEANKFLKNDSGYYVYNEFEGKEAGEYLVEVIAEMSEMENSKAEQLKIVKLAAPTFSQDGGKILANTEVENVKINVGLSIAGNMETKTQEGQSLILDNIAIEAGQSATISAHIEKINAEENVDGLKIYYLTSDATEIVVEKIATPHKLEAIKDENNSNKLTLKWLSDSGLIYNLLQNGHLIDVEQQKTTEGGKEFAYVVIDNIANAAEYEYSISAVRENLENKFYLPSDISAPVVVKKLEQISASYDQTTKTISYKVNEDCVGTYMVLQVIVAGQAESRGKTVPVGSVSGTIELNEMLVGVENCEIRLYLIKENDDVVYLNSNILNLVLTKLLPISCNYIVENEDSEIRVIIAAQENATKYSIYLNGNVLSTTPSQDAIYATELLEGVADGEKYLTFTVKNINFAGNYKLSIIAEGENSEGSPVYILNSEATDYEFIKLATPVLTYEKTTDENISFNWGAVDYAKYLITVQNLKTNQTLMNKEQSSSSFSYQFKDDVEYLVSVVAIPASTKGNYLKSNKNDENSFVKIIKLSEAQNIVHTVVQDLINDEYSSVVEFDAVADAESYNLKVRYGSEIIKSFNTYQIEDGKVKFNLGDISLYGGAGQYSIIVTATSSEMNVLDSKESTHIVKKLSKPTNIFVNYGESSTTLRFEVEDNHNHFNISIDGEVSNITSNSVDISDLRPGNHQVEIYAVGNGKELLSSDVVVASINVLTRLAAPQNVNFEVNAANDEETILTFDKVENAAYYQILCKNASSEFAIELRPESILDSYSVTIERAKFFDGIQKIYVVAKPADNSDEFTVSEKSTEIYIRKSAQLTSMSNVDGRLDLTGKQADIDGTIYTNVTIECDWLLSGEKKTINVRNVATVIDKFDAGKVFNLAGPWVEVELQRLTVPTLEIDNDNVTYSYVDEGVKYNLILKIDYIGRNSSDNSTLNSAEFNLTTMETASTFDIRQFINNNFNSPDKVGDYKISIYAKAIGNDDLKLNFDSEYSSNALNGSDEDYRYTENLDNSNAMFGQNNNGEISLTISNAYLLKLNKVYLQVEQAGKACRIEINLKTGSVNQLENTLNNVALSPSRENVAGGLKFKVNIHALVNAGAVKVSYNLIGDDVYYISSSVLADNNLNKLATPTFEYQYDQNGNKIVLTDAAVTSGKNVKFFAKYAGEKREFVVSSNSTYFYLPYDWTNILNVKICAETEEVGFINSNEADVNFARASKISNLHLTEDSASGNTYLEFDTPNNAFNYYVYVHAANGNCQEILSVNSNKVLISDELLTVGNATFKVAVKGYVSGGVTYLNSELVSLNVKKLDNQITITNPSGVLTWNTLVNENEIKEFRIKVGSTLYNFDPKVHSFDLKDLSGYMTIYFKVVGDPAQNIISSNYKEFSVYKYSAPSSFKVQDGQFNINENLANVELEGGLHYIIYFGENSFLYNDYLTYDDSILEQFYELLGDGATGKAAAKIIVETGSKVQYGGKEYIAVNSDKTAEIDFGVYKIDTTNDEFYLTQKAITDGTIDTYFNWEWVDETFASKGMVRIIIKPQFVNKVAEIEDWEVILDESNQVAAYYLDATPNNTYTSEIYAKSTICVKLPADLPAGSYTIQVQKTAIATDTNLSSENVSVVNFVRLSAPNVEVKGGKLTWAKQQLANHYLMRYANSANNLFWEYDILENSFEPHSFYASADSQNKFMYKMLAVGNVGELKPTENLKALSFEYVVASQNFAGEFTKLRAPGEICLINGVLRWKDETATTYNYYSVENKEPILEFVFMNLELEVLTSVKIPAKDLLAANTLAFIDNYLTAAQRNKLKSSGKVIIKYRQLGETFENYINSEYVYLDVANSQTTVINGIVRSYYEFLNAAENVTISETEGLSFAAVTYDANLLSEVVYDIYFKIGASSSATIKLVKSQSTLNISFAELKELLRVNDPNADISEIFVVARGNNTYYLSSLKSTVMYVNTINGEASMRIEDGLIKWKHIEGAGSYVIKSVLGDNEPIEYVVRRNGVKFYINNVETTSVKTEYNYSSNETIWIFDIAKYDGIADGEHNLFIRYMPNAGNVFAFPGEWTTTAIRVYKIGTPEISLENGIFVWDDVAQAQKYKIEVLYNEGAAKQILDSIETDKHEYVLKVDPSKNISQYSITFQSVGTNGSVNGIYYISSAVIVKDGLQMQVNDITDVVIDGDIISWGGQGEKHILYVTGQDGKNEISEMVTVEGNSYDLSLLKLHGGETAEYQITIQVAGDSEKLASTVSEAISFKVLPTMDEIGLEEGYIKFKKQPNATVYTLTLEVGSNIYRYTIELEGGAYKVTNLTHEYTTTGDIKDKDISSENDIKQNGDYIYFCPGQINMTSSTGILSVKANGYKVDGTTYISSYDKEYGARITRPDISKVTISNVVADKETNTTKISWKLSLNFEFRLKYVLYKLVGEEYEKVDLTNASLNDSQTMLTLNEALEAGSYKLELQIIPIDSAFYMKSIVKTFPSFTVR